MDAALKIKIASPCKASWENMSGDERVRHCGACKLNVYDISAMTADQALTLIRGTEGQLCVRLHARPDGRVITRNCPVGWRARLRRRAAWLTTMMGAAAGLLITAVAGLGAGDRDVPGMLGVRYMKDWLAPTLTPTPMLMGAVCITPVPPGQSPTGLIIEVDEAEADPDPVSTSDETVR